MALAPIPPTDTRTLFRPVAAELIPLLRGLAPADWERLVAVLDDDVNTPEALALLHEWRGRGVQALLDSGLQIFGLALPPMAGTGLNVDRLRRERDDARGQRDWAKADSLRDEIRREGFDVIDDADGSRLVPL